jgi:cardiolipin synthase
VFFEDDLHELRRERFHPAVFARYVRRAASRIREHMVANPGAVRSIWILALAYLALAFAGAVVIALTLDHRLAADLFRATALLILPVFLILTCAVDLLRDREGFRLSAVNLPIALTLMRVMLAPGIVLFLLDRHFGAALVLYVIAALSDVADGWLARRTGQTTRLGTLMDPIVDILFNLAMLGALMAAGLLPIWVVVIGALRYAILLVGGASLFLFVGPLRIQPTWFGRLSGVLMSCLVGFRVLLSLLGGTLAERLTGLTEIALGALLATTVGQVVALGWYNIKIMSRPAETPGRVVGDVRWGSR